MSLWTKSIESIGWQDVIDFLELRLPEGSRLDYKGDLPANLEKHLAAFANTQGGYLLIGVDQDPNTGVPILPPKCVPLKGLARIEQKGLEAVYPGFIPDVRLVENPERPGHGVAVVMVHESPQAPHAIQNSTRVYVRTGQHSTPEDLADLPRLERLIRRRSEREAQRDSAIEDAQGRTMSLFPTYTWSALAVSPLYPDAQLKAPRAVLEWARTRFNLRRFYPRAGGATSTEFLAPAANEPRGRLDRQIELSATGLSYFASSCDVDDSERGARTLNLQQLTCAAARDLEDASQFLDWLGFHGHVRIQLALTDTRSR
jgi:hypothetical protein